MYCVCGRLYFADRPLGRGPIQKDRDACLFASFGCSSENGSHSWKGEGRGSPSPNPNSVCVCVCACVCVCVCSQLLLNYASQRRLTFTGFVERPGKCPPQVKGARPNVVLAFSIHFRFSFAADSHISNYRFRLQYYRFALP